MPRYKSVESALARGVMQADSALDAAKIWIWMMRDCRHDDPILTAHGELLLSGLEYLGAALARSAAEVDIAIDRAAAAVSSLDITPDAFARWDAAEDWQIGKQGYRFDAASIVIGIGRAATAGEDEGALIDAGANEFVEHLVRQGAIEDTEEEREGAAQRERGTTVRVVAVLTQNTPRSC